MRGQQADAQRRRGLGLVARHFLAAIDDGCDGNAGRLQIEGGSIGVAVVGEHHGASAWPDRIFRGVAPRGGGQHDARQVVVGEHQVSFDGAGGEHHAPGTDQPQAMARPMGRRFGQMIRHPLEQAHDIVVEIAERRGARQDDGVGMALQVVGRPVGPGQARRAIDRVALETQGAAEARALVGEDDPRAGAGRLLRGRQPRGTAAHHQHVAMGVTMLVAVGIGQVGRTAEAGRAADEALVGHPQ